MVSLATAVAVAALGCSGSQARRVGCSKDTDCRAPRVCERGDCVERRVARDGSTADAPPAVPPFAMFGGDARHTGRRGGPAPARAPKEQWKVPLGGPVAGSPTIGPDGTIYATSHAGALLAFDPAGKQRWRFPMGDRSWSTPAIAE